jgi:uncharacterized membrane protein
MIVASVAIVAAMLALSGWAWLQLPTDALVPIHWGPNGEPDAFADKTLGLLVLPAVTACLAAVLWAIPSIEPRRENLARSATAYRATWLGAVLLLGGLHGLAVAAALGAELDVTRIVLIATGALLIVIGNYLPKVRSNYLLGIRTPWTLTSDLSWHRTHRLGGRLFVIAGVVLIALGASNVAGDLPAAALVALIVVPVAGLFAYSFFVWRSDPDRRGM